MLERKYCNYLPMQKQVYLVMGLLMSAGLLSEVLSKCVTELLVLIVGKQASVYVSET